MHATPSINTPFVIVFLSVPDRHDAHSPELRTPSLLAWWIFLHQLVQVDLALTRWCCRAARLCADSFKQEWAGNAREQGQTCRILSGNGAKPLCASFPNFQRRNSGKKTPLAHTKQTDRREIKVFRFQEACPGSGWGLQLEPSSVCLSMTAARTALHPHRHTTCVHGLTTEA